MLDLRGAYALLLLKNENVGRMLENGSPRVSIAESKTTQYRSCPWQKKMPVTGVFCSGGNHVQVKDHRIVSLSRPEP